MQSETPKGGKEAEKSPAQEEFVALLRLVTTLGVTFCGGILAFFFSGCWPRATRF